MMTSSESWSLRTMQSTAPKTVTAAVGAISPSRLCFDDDFVEEHSDLFRETIIARNVYAAWARKLTNAKPNDPDLQNIHMEVSKSGEIVSTHLAKLDVPLFKIPASEKELDRIILRSKNKTVVSPKKREEKKPAAVPPPPSTSPRKGRKAAKRTVDWLRRLRSPQTTCQESSLSPLVPSTLANPSFRACYRRHTFGSNGRRGDGNFNGTIASSGRGACRS
ncbi:hypothetical protein TNCV_3945131 [Trichonephila clavipes]|nr:hypothetical protein TNCV_3945131 [Trichonephila clavipes]